MINTNEKLLDQLDADQYFLISKIVKYGKKSCPKNEVLRHATGWGIKKVQRVKKELILLGFMLSNKRWKYVDGKRMRDSNQYVITTDLISKYRGKEYAQQCQIGIVQIGTDEGGIVQLGIDEFELDEVELDENGTGNKVLRIIIIEEYKVLSKKSIEREKDTPLHIQNLETQLKNLQAENLELKNKEEKPKEKTSAKKEKRTFPDNTPRKTYSIEVPKTESKQTKPYEMHLNNYPFVEKGWSIKLVKRFFLYCETKDEKSYKGYAVAQMNMRITEINEALDEHEMEWIESLVYDAASGAWASFKFDERIKARKLKQQNDETKQAANNGKSMYENYADMLNGNSNNDNDDTIDVSWAEA